MIKRHNGRIAAIVLLAAILTLLVFCWLWLWEDYPITPPPTLPVSATPSDTPLPPTVPPATATFPPSHTPPAVSATATPPPTGTATSTSSVQATPTEAAVPPSLTPTATAKAQAPPLIIVTVGSVHDTLWYLAWRFCGNANEWGTLQRVNGVRDPRWLQLGDRLEMRCN